MSENAEICAGLFDLMSQGIIVQNEKGEIRTANKAAERILGRSLLSIDIRTIYPDSRSCPVENRPPMQALRTGLPVLGVTLGFTHPDREKTVWVKIDSFPQIDAQTGATREVRSIFTDVTEFVEIGREREKARTESRVALAEAARSRTALLSVIEDQKLTEETLKRTHENLKYLFETINTLSGVRTMEEIRRIIVMAARKLVQSDGTTFVLRKGESCWYAEEDAIAPLWKGQKFPLDDCISGWAIRNNETAIVFDIYTDSRVPSEYYRSTFVKSLTVIPINRAEPIGAIGNYWAKHHIPTAQELNFLITLTESAAIAIEKVQLLENLERRVAERTADLEASNRELESFSYSVSHDLRAPLRAIDGYVRILMEEYSPILGDEGMRISSIISSSAIKMGQLIDDLLAFSRAGKGLAARSPIDMRAMAAGVYHEIVQETMRDRTEFIVSPLPMARGDAILVRQVWANLIGNALKFSSRIEHPRIIIDSREENGEVVYFISDNGAGFDMRYVSKIFGVFQRLHTQSEFEGTGIGLAIVQRIILKHGGRVWAESEPGKGSTFFFTLSREDSNEQE